MTPAHAPLPTDCSRPFQPDAGIQTSMWMSESLDGFNVAVTRQNAGRCLYGSPACGKAPGAISSALVIEVFGSASEATLPHEVAAASGTLTRPGARVTTTSRDLRSMLFCRQDIT